MYNDSLQQVYLEAKLSTSEIDQMGAYIEGSLEFYGSPAYDKLYEYFAFETGEMPYEVAKARTATPDEWILDYLEDLMK